jgi:Sulfotransferase family
MNEVTSPRIVHLHIPKTAGTALRVAFKEAAGGTLRIFPHYDERQYIGIDASQYDFYSGHFGFKTATQLGGEILTILRNPVDRFVSVYYFWRQLFEKGVEQSQNTFLANKYPLREFVKIRDEPSLLEEFYNRMTWQIAHGSSLALRRELREEGKSDDDIFKLALANLSSFSVVGVQERLGAFQLAVEQKFSVALKIRKANVTGVRAEVEEIDTVTIRAIQDWSFMDLELYHHACKLVSQEAFDHDSA